MLGLPGIVLSAVSADASEVEQAMKSTAGEDFCRAGCGLACTSDVRRGCGIFPRPGGRAVMMWAKEVCYSRLRELGGITPA